MLTTNDLFVRFKERLASVGGEAYSVDRLEQATEIIVAHPALVQREIVVAPDFATSQSWAAILPLLRDKGIEIREAESPAGASATFDGLPASRISMPLSRKSGRIAAQ